jgi:hypothetical protein
LYRQEVVEQLRAALMAHPRAARCCLDRQLPLLLQLPPALRLLLRGVPATGGSLALVYRRLCRCLDAGLPTLIHACE